MAIKVSEALFFCVTHLNSK